MKPGSITTGKTFLTLFVFAAIAFALISWDRRHHWDNPDQKGQVTDTIPDKKEKKIRDLDEAIAELEGIDLKIHLDKAMKEVESALKQLDTEKIRLDVERSMKEVDFDKIKMDLDKAVKEIDFAKIEKEVKESLAKVDFDKLKMELEEIKETDLKKLDEELAKTRAELQQLGPRLEKELNNARAEIEKAKAEMKEYKSFVDDLAADGLINKKESYTIRHKDGKLIINDREADGKTYEKYQNFLQQHKAFKIEKDQDDFNIDID